MTPDDYVWREKGTLNLENGHFTCTECYIKSWNAVIAERMGSAVSEGNKLTGRKLDAMVAERVMAQVSCQKWRHVNFGSGGPAMVNEDCEHNGQCFPAETGPLRYSESIEAAMQVVEKMLSDGYDPEMIGHDGWYVVFKRTHTPQLRQYGKSLPMAICRAALAAIDSQQEHQL